MAVPKPKATMDRLEKIFSAWKQLASAESFGGMTLAQFETFVNNSKNDRAAIVALEDQLTAAQDKRDDTDKVSLAKAELVVNGVIGDPAFGPDSALYEAMGYIRKSERKSGLTRKKKITP